MKDKGLAFLILCASVGFMVWTASGRRASVRRSLAPGETRDSVAPGINQPFGLPLRETFTVGYEKKGEEQPEVPAALVQEVSAAETVSVSCAHGNCEFKEQAEKPQVYASPPVELFAEAPIAPHAQEHAPQHHIHVEPHPQAPQHHAQEHDIHAQPHPQAPQHHAQEHDIHAQPRRRAVRDISHANPFMR